MKIPSKDDPGGDKETAVPRAVVLQVLRDNDVEVIQLGDNFYVLSNTEEVIAEVFPDPIGGLMVRSLAHRFVIDLIEFYHDPLNGGQRRKPNLH